MSKIDKKHDDNSSIYDKIKIFIINRLNFNGDNVQNMLELFLTNYWDNVNLYIY